MKIMQMDQRSAEWYVIRGTIPTASSFGKIFTGTGKASTQAGLYMNELLANWLGAGREEDDGFTSPWMQRGTDMEDESLAYYEMIRADVDTVGFCLRDDGLAGCSPDGLVPGLGRGLEMKNPKASTQVQYLLDQELPNTYKPQVQGSMWVTGFREWDFLSYHPELEPLLITVERDEEYIAALEQAIMAFTAKMQLKKEQLIRYGYQAAA